MTCRDLVEKLLEYIQGELDADLCEHINHHLSSCPPCMRYVETYRLTIRLTRKLPAAPLPPELLQRLRKALEKIEE